ncbi:DNA-binding protein [Alicycliphilus denitrificans]|uniref:DNA-binding protein n=1 Tax=Alicycliphilus denitrificans TaxID=179636 RepID=A0A858ZPH0_9BURK|nr:DNA-binding protein [Alicycliphilus denitrificans]QKD42604.1 DNA-binding protein [Alicycliphilus denitrificans]
MNEIVRLRLADFIGGKPEAWGNDRGREVFVQLLAEVERHLGALVFEISLDGIRRTDASFPRESVVELARRFRKQFAFVVTHAINEDLLFNWDAAAVKKEQPLFVKAADGSWTMLGPQLSAAKDRLLEYVMNNKKVRTAQVAADLSLKISNASTQLRDLWEMGYVLRREETADTGGVEFVYLSIV